MTPELVIEVGKDAGTMTLLLAGPPLLTGLAVGLVVGMFQAATQIQEMTLTFIPKLLGVGASLIIGGNWMMTMFMDYSLRLYESIPILIG